MLLVDVLVWAAADMQINMYHVQDFELVSQITTSHTAPITQLRLVQHNQIWSFGEDKAVTIWK
jgi:hypothetical protein